jgi:hypothetical protein
MIHQSQKMACGPRVVLGTLSGERHALGSLLAAFLASAYGIHCCYKARLPARELAEAVVRTEAKAVGLGLINLSLSAVQDPVVQLSELSDRLPTGVELWLGAPRWRSYRRTTYPRAA